MKLSLSLKFIITYILLGITGFILLNTAGAQLVEDHIISRESSRLYTSATSLASTKAIRSYQDAETYFDRTLPGDAGSRCAQLSAQGYLICSSCDITRADADHGHHPQCFLYSSA